MTTVYELGPFQLDTESGVLLRSGVAEPLGKRAVSVLVTLVANPRIPLTKHAIIDAAWQGLVVEEANLSVQISAIRRVLAQAPGGERWIETLAGRGYRYVGPVTELRDGAAYGSRRDQLGNLPAPLDSFVGRERELVDLKRLLASNRSLTLVGAGGVGKTRLAVQLAAEVVDAYRDGVWFIDLAPLGDGGFVPSAMAQALEVQHTPERSLTDALCRHLKGQRALLIIDNCEHVLDASTQLIEAILRGASEPTILATSREPLRVEGEQIYWLASLPLPDAAAGLEAIREADAVALFVDRAQHQEPTFSLTEANARGVASLCARLDGIPLALELAAPLVHTYSIDEINARIADWFDPLTEGRRTGLPRQQTLRATLDWSYGLLSEDERALLRKVSVFRGGFTRQAATFVADGTTSELAAVDPLSRLVARSLATPDTTSGDRRYRLLETTRAYALHKLIEAGEIDAAERRHARFFREFFEDATNQYWRIPDAQWRGLFAAEIDNLRAALQWAFGAGGDRALGIRLSGTSAAIWWELSLQVEGAQRIEAALANVGPGTPESEQALLWFWLGYQTQRARPAQAIAALERAAALYRRIDDASGLGCSLAILGAVSAYHGGRASALAYFGEAMPLLKNAGRPKIFAEHFLALGFLEANSGRFEAAELHLEMAASLCRESGAERVAIGAVAVSAYIDWSCGRHDAAISGYQTAAALARKLNRMLALGNILTELAGVLVERGRLTEALSAAREGVPLRRAAGQMWDAADYLALRSALAGNIETAARLAGFADCAHAERQVARQPNEARARERLHALLRERLDPVRLEKLLADGARLTEDEACRLALEE